MEVSQETWDWIRAEVKKLRPEKEAASSLLLMWIWNTATSEPPDQDELVKALNRTLEFITTKHPEVTLGQDLPQLKSKIQSFLERVKHEERDPRQEIHPLLPEEGGEGGEGVFNKTRTENK